MKRKLTFEITSCKDYFEQIVLPSVEVYNANPLSYKNALSTAIFCWQFSDWIYNSHTLKLHKQLRREGFKVTNIKEYQGVLMKMPCFSFISQIAIGAKHLICKDDRIQNITSTQKETGFFRDRLGLRTAIYLTIKVGTQRYYFSRELKKCIEYWNIVLLQLDIYKETDK